MLLTYFDEVAYSPPRQPYQWIAGIIVPAALVSELETSVNELADECFGSSRLSKETEFHATAIFSRSDNFKTWLDPTKRAEVLRRLLKLIDRHDEISKVFARLEPRRMVASDNLDHRAFMFFVERVEMAVADRKTLGLLIGDFASKSFSSLAVRSLSSYRADGTPYEFGRPITHLIDTVHFTDSHHSRLLQLADCYAWALQVCDTTREEETGHRAEMARWIRSETRLLSAHRLKVWPTGGSRLQVE